MTVWLLKLNVWLLMVVVPLLKLTLWLLVDCMSIDGGCVFTKFLCVATDDGYAAAEVNFDTTQCGCRY